MAIESARNNRGENMIRTYLSVIVILIIFSAGCETYSQSRRLKYVTAHQELSPEQKDLVLKGKLWVGMSKDEVRAVLGDPTDVQKEMLNESEVWSYMYKGQLTTHRPFEFDRVLRLQFAQDRLANWRDD